LLIKRDAHSSAKKDPTPVAAKKQVLSKVDRL
jgi:hypothetical protein